MVSQPEPDMPARPSSWWRWLFGWLFPGRGGKPAGGPSSPAESASSVTDDCFTALGSGSVGGFGVLRPSKSRSSLAAAYAQASNPPPQSTPPVAANTAQWKVLEPTDRRDPVPHEECRLEARGSWALLGASVRGKLHAHQALWRDDAFSWGHTGEWTCLAAADGAGSAPLARVGSRLACQESIKALVASLADWKLTPGEKPAQEDLKRLRSCVAGAVRKALTAIDHESLRRDCNIREFHTTCLLLVHAPFGEADLVAGLQVGDGAIALLCAPGNCEVLGDADHGEFSSETRFLTTPNIADELEMRTVFCMRQGLLAAAVLTDGVADDFFPESDRLIEMFEGAPISDLRTASGQPLHGLAHGVLREPRSGQALVDWLRYEKRGSSDDRTVAVFYRVPPAPVEGQA
jgi:hypothetical protein